MYKRSMLFVVGLLCSLGMAAQLRVFQDDFESGFPGSWTQEQVKGTYSWELQTGAACTYPTGAHSGESRVWFYAPANDPATTRLVTPVIDASGLVTPARVNFLVCLAGIQRNARCERHLAGVCPAVGFGRMDAVG